MSYRFFLLVQEALKKLYKTGQFDPSWRYSLAIDVAYDRKKAYTAGILYDMKNEEVIKIRTAISSIPFPYIPGLLYARETPPILGVAEDLKFDLLIVNGHGRLHPRRAGLATMAGILLDVPSIGVANKLLCGEVMGKEKVNPVILDGKVEGFEVVLNKGRFYISPGNFLDAEAVYEFIRLRNFKYPRELELADRESKKLKKSS